MPKLEKMLVGQNTIGDQGMAALAPVLQKLTLLTNLVLWGNHVGDDGLASLVDNLGKDDFKKLEELDLDYNDVTDVGCAKLVSAIKARAMPCLHGSVLEGNEMVSEEAHEALGEALAANSAAAAPGVLAHEIPPSSADGE